MSTAPPGRRGGMRSRLSRRSVAALGALSLLLGGAGATWAATGVTVTNSNKLVARGPVNTTNGFPVWYEDSAKTRLELCLDGDNPFCGFLPGDIPDPTKPISFPDNYPEEVFYFLAGGEIDLPGGGRLVYTTGLESAFANAVAHGEQMVFGRVRIVVKGGPANTTITVRHPYGAAELDLDGTGSGRIVEDIGASVGAFDAALKSNVGPFLVAEGGLVSGPDGGKYVGNPDLPTRVTGGLNGNTLSVTGGGLDLSTNEFTIQGKVATNHGVTADAAVVNADGFLDVFATSGGSAVEVVGVDGSFATTGMRQDPATERWYARVKLTGPAPAEVTLRNISDKPASTSKVAVDSRDITVTKASYDGTTLTVEATAKGGGELAVKGLGPLTSGSPATFTVSAPPAVVTVTKGNLSATLPVSVSGGEATVPLAPVPPSDQVDPTPGGDTSTSTGGTVTPGTGTGGTTPPPGGTDPQPPQPAAPQVVLAQAKVTAVRGGAAVTLDASASTGVTAYKWTVPSESPVTIVDGATTAKPTVRYAAAPASGSPVSNDPVTVRLTATGPGGEGTGEVVVTPDVDTLAVTANRHRLGSELRVDGTSLFGTPAAARALIPATQVSVYDISRAGQQPTLLGRVNVDTLGAWSYRVKPGPNVQVTRVLVQSSRGGSAEAALTTR